MVDCWKWMESVNSAARQTRDSDAFKGTIVGIDVDRWLNVLKNVHESQDSIVSHMFHHIYRYYIHWNVSSVVGVRSEVNHSKKLYTAIDQLFTALGLSCLAFPSAAVALAQLQRFGKT